MVSFGSWCVITYRICGRCIEGFVKCINIWNVFQMFKRTIKAVMKVSQKIIYFDFCMKKMFYFVWLYNNILTPKMLQMPPFCMLIFKNFTGGDTPGPPSWASCLRRPHSSAYGTPVRTSYNLFGPPVFQIYWSKWATADSHMLSTLHTKSHNLNASCLVMQLSLPSPLKPGVKWRMKM